MRGWTGLLLSGLMACSFGDSGGGALPFQDSCERFADFLEDECGMDLGTSTQTSDFDCSDDTTAACQAECGLRADCQIFLVPDDPTDQGYLDAVQDYSDCVVGC